MSIKEYFGKLRFVIRHKIFNSLQHQSFYPKLYKAYWHAKFNKSPYPITLNYFSSIPNRGAGIGHQMANWIAGYWFAQQFKLQFAHSPFSKAEWEFFLGFGEGEITVKELLKCGYKKVRLPLFNEYKKNEVGLITKIIQSYQHKRVVFVTEQDQFYHDQFGVADDLREKFYAANARINDKLIYSPENFNIALHVRRGDIEVENKSPNLLLRWQENSYFEKVLINVIENIRINKPIAIYLFSQGEQKDFPQFSRFSNLNFCLHMNAINSFLHMVCADLLITSKSSFSYKPALLSKGIKVCPADFWHGYPARPDWILVENDGTFDNSQLKTITLNKS
jgi:hypothetical protein